MYTNCSFYCLKDVVDTKLTQSIDRKDMDSLSKIKSFSSYFLGQNVNWFRTT